MKIRYYLDENVPVRVAQQLRARGINAVTARDLGLLGASDETHLQQATAMGRVVCTYDADFLRLAAAEMSHNGIRLALSVLRLVEYQGAWGLPCRNQVG